ncbi:MAG TPA: hypothetical protein VHA33_25535 [Candidatus Angelobacter sp.]|jgi:hypothetical protein|nr:hypothetical protein [Candidatus Angelobacter sp.]
MAENPTADGKGLQVIAWATSVLASGYFIFMYFQTSRVIHTFADLFSGLGVDLPLNTRMVLTSQYLLPLLFICPAVLVVGKELFMRDKKLSLATTFFVALVVVFAMGWIHSALFAPLETIVQKIK